MSTERIIVDRKIADAFVAKLAAKAVQLSLGDPRKGPVVLGSVVDASTVERCNALIDDALAKGAKLVCGGKADSTLMPATLLDHVQSGRLRAIAVSGKERSGLLPEVPTIAQSGHPGFDATFFETLMAPSSLPAATVEKIQRDVRAALLAPAVKARLAEMDLRVEGYSTQEAERRSQEDFAKWGTVAQRTQLQLD